MEEERGEAAEGAPLLISYQDGEDHGSRNKDGKRVGGGGNKLSAIFQMFLNVITPQPHRPTNSTFLTIFLIVNTMIGSGILNQPHVFGQAGVVGALILYVFAIWGIYTGLLVLVDSGIRVNALDYTDLAIKVWGPRGGLAIDIAIVVQNFGALCSYFILVGSLLSNVLGQWAHDQHHQSWSLSFTFLLCIAVGCIVLPICLTRYFGHLSYISVASIAAISVVTLTVLVAGPVDSRSGVVKVFAVSGALQGLGSLVFACSCASVTFHAYTTMVPSTSECWKNVSMYAVVSGASLCVVMGLTGYLSYREDTDSNIVMNFHWAGGSALKLLVVLHLLLYIPGDYVIMRHNLMKVFKVNVLDIPTTLYAIITTLLLIAPLLVVLSLHWAGVSNGNAFDYVLDLTGGMSSSVISFILPAGIYLTLHHVDGDGDGEYDHSVSEYESKNENTHSSNDSYNNNNNNSNNRSSSSSSCREAQYLTQCKLLLMFGTFVFVSVPVSVFWRIGSSS